LRRAQEELEQRVEVRTADLRTANLKLQKVLEERRRLENELLEIAENERRCIGFDLHDDLGQKLTGASFMIKGLEHKLAAEHHPGAADAARIQNLIDQIISHTHNLARQFSSLEATGEDLCAVLRSLAANVKKMFDISCEVRTCETPPDLPGNTLLQLQKITQEAVNNAVKHGKATRVWIALAREEGHLVLTIRNNGAPFSPPAGPTKRMGLRIMNYRANTVGASLDIKPEKEGTLVCCSLPLNGTTHTTRRSLQGRKARRSGMHEFDPQPSVSEQP
jgi:signal transduction histidine kinase